MQLLVQQLSPEPSYQGYGIEVLETTSYVLQAFQPQTGVQFFVTADLKTENLGGFLVSTVTTLRSSQFPIYCSDLSRHGWWNWKNDSRLTWHSLESQSCMPRATNSSLSAAWGIFTVCWLCDEKSILWTGYAYQGRSLGISFAGSSCEVCLSYKYLILVNLSVEVCTWNLYNIVARFRHWSTAA